MLRQDLALVGRRIKPESGGYEEDIMGVLSLGYRIWGEGYRWP